MLEKVHSFIKKHQLLTPNSTVVVGVSGGPDSLALLHFFCTIQHDWNLTVIAAHVDHMFRGKESAEDMNFVKHVCEKFGIICETKQINVPSFQRQWKISAQEAARECRYRFFKEVMEKHSATYLALAHHGDDQIETILMRLVRGSNGRGYAGIPAKRPFYFGQIIRPFLAVSRDDIEEYCREHALKPRYDASNEKDSYTRNRFRRYVVPFLKKENPHVHERFQHYSEMVAEDETFLEELTSEAMNKVMEKQHGAVILHIKPFQTLPKPLQRRGIQLILNYLYNGVPSSLSSIHINHVLALLHNNHPSGRLDFPNGLKVIRSYQSCVFTFHEQESYTYTFELDVPSVLHLPNGYAIISEFWEHYPREQKGNDTFIVDPEAITFPLRVRTRRAGDRMTLKGTKGTKKIKEIFIEEKIPLHERESWPIVEDGQGNILWLPKLKKSAFEATDVTKTHYLVLHYKEQ
ncbi:tRNA lysidine(34) synthetase TilS [Thermaerobacillus caldiproteolyticus]|uniref:tRNA(Ile)-lysidine synthase n=1 Tax=Thermaerobacillus caldiproteolyticus TaxID=247480 RepID=A0A7V9ZA70_9BACL|nr:tRNA lysidine(34) synthetase TilS [Anoxybacillus caldiproteolyticus]MBA2876721.1 tRNA(Ile)-lysidine synthase [Anoxybacillus caldiproteolyticus]QPA31014.1 tRNA lysidine(34) synthetase TilS [Anoxybacillus caldiproteolyticus]